MAPGTDLTGVVKEWRKDRHRDAHWVWVDWTLTEKPQQHPGSSECLLHVNQSGWVIAYS